MIELVSKDKCSGCSACFNACKVGALSMVTNETGFWFPHIDREKCVECGACVSACPALAKPEYKSENQKAYIVQNKDEEIRRQSTSGGAFTAIAKQIICQGGVVFGAAMDDDYNVSHIWVDNEADLAKFRSSKYVQSRIGLAYREAEKFLKDGQMVCFSGTPCQIYGLKKYLGGGVPKGILITVDVVCRAVPSPLILKKYLELQKEKFPQFDRLVFRDKGRGYSHSGIALYEGNKAVYRGGSESDPWLRIFLNGYCNRETCYECLYQDGVRSSDITLWDCWRTNEYAPEWNDNKGTTTVVAWSQNGRNFVEANEANLRLKEIPMDYVSETFKRNSLKKPLNYNRKQFFEDCETLEAHTFFNKYEPTTIKVVLKREARELLHKLHLHDFARELVHKLREKNPLNK